MTDSNNNYYIIKRNITITQSEIPVIKKQETSKQKSNNNILLVFLLTIIILLPIIAYIFIFQNETKNQIISLIKKITTSIYSYAKKTIIIIYDFMKKTKNIIFDCIDKLKTFISEHIITIKSQKTNDKKIGLINYFTKKNIDILGKKIEKINANINSDIQPNFITNPTPTSSYNFDLNDLNTYRDNSNNNNGKTIIGFLKDKSKNLMINDRISNYYKKLFKNNRNKLDETKSLDTTFNIDKISDKSNDKLTFKKNIKNDLVSEDIFDNIDDIVDEILKSKFK
jgi:hypothetical protein